MGTSPEMPSPDLMLLDLNLPKLDGTTILQEFRKHPECAHTPVIVVTSSDAEKDSAKVTEFQVTRFFRKPSDFNASWNLGRFIKSYSMVRWFDPLWTSPLSQSILSDTNLSYIRYCCYPVGPVSPGEVIDASEKSAYRGLTSPESPFVLTAPASSRNVY
jgi:CheY-like chemotaxis protein